jgi:hypothetical protein
MMNFHFPPALTDADRSNGAVTLLIIVSFSMVGRGKPRAYPF